MLKLKGLYLITDHHMENVQVVDMATVDELVQAIQDSKVIKVIDAGGETYLNTDIIVSFKVQNGGRGPAYASLK